MKRFSLLVTGLICVFLAIVFTYLALFCLSFTTVIDTDNYVLEAIVRVNDPLLINLLAAGLFILAFRLLSRFEKRLSLPLLTGLAIAIPAIAGFVWALAARVVPRADQAQVFTSAADLIAGQTETITAEGSYFQRLPHQLGQLLAFEGIERVFGTNSLPAFYLINALSLAAINGALLSILWQSFHDRRIQLCACLLLFFFTPAILYSTFVYGLLPGLALALWGVECAAAWMRTGGWGRTVTALVLLSLACMLKANYLIIALATAVAMLLSAVQAKKRLAVVVFALLLFLVPFGMRSVPVWLMEARTGVAFDSGTPQAAWLAMGMNINSRSSPGWYNSYPWTVIEDAQFDPTAARTLIRAAIRDRAAEFVADPAEALHFYHAKLISQWAETTYESIWVNRVCDFVSPRSTAVSALLEGRFLPRMMDGYAVALYAAFAAGLLWLARGLFRRKAPVAAPFGLSALIFAVLGGLLYHLLFEAKSQYLLPYVLMMIPLAACGLTRPVRFKRLFTRRPPMV